MSKISRLWFVNNVQGFTPENLLDNCEAAHLLPAVNQNTAQCATSSPPIMCAGIGCGGWGAPTAQKVDDPLPQTQESVGYRYRHQPTSSDINTDRKCQKPF